MIAKVNRGAFIIVVPLSILVFFASVYARIVKDPVDYVDPNIGTIAHLLVATAPIVQLPHGMVELAHNPSPETRDRYLASKIASFSIRALPHYSIATIPSWIMATTGKLQVNSEMDSYFDHDFETVTPYYSAVLLEDYDINVEYTVTEHAAYYRFTFPKSSDSHILIGSNSKVKILKDYIIEGVENARSATAYFYAEFSKPFASYGAWKNEQIFIDSKEQSGDSIGVVTNFTTSQEEQIEVKIGISYIDIKQARQNLEKEIPAWDFEGVKNQAKNIWNKALSKIKIEGGTEKQRTIFYSALYRVMLGSQSMNLTEYGRYYSRVDNKVHNTDGHDFYRVGSNWGSHHSLFPLFLLLEPEKQNALMRSYVLVEEQGNWISTSGGRHNMIGHHEAATITDAYMKGFRILM